MDGSCLDYLKILGLKMVGFQRKGVKEKEEGEMGTRLVLQMDDLID